MSRFPVYRKDGQTFRFYAAPFMAKELPFASLVFAWQEDSVLVSRIVNRGWCVPSGRLKAGESSLDAAIREAQEEASAALKNVRYIGCFGLIDRGGTMWADCFVAEVDRLSEFKANEETVERRLFSYCELPGIYYLWNPLTEAVFRFSKEFVS